MKRDAERFEEDSDQASATRSGNGESTELAADERKAGSQSLDQAARRATTAARSGEGSVGSDEGEKSGEGGVPASPTRSLSVRQKAATAVAAAFSLVLIAVSAAFLLPGQAIGPLRDGSQATSATTSAERADAQASSATDSDVGNETDAAADSADFAGGSAGDAGASQDASDPAQPASASASGGSDGADAGAAADEGSSGSGEASSSGGGGSPASGDVGSGGQSGSQQPSTVAVSVSVSSAAVGGSVSGGVSTLFSTGATAYDALMACGLSVNASSTAYGVYVRAIGGLAEKEHGGNSGWMYSVNGTVPQVACSGYILQDGDAVQWYYVV